MGSSDPRDRAWHAFDGKESPVPLPGRAASVAIGSLKHKTDGHIHPAAQGGCGNVHAGEWETDAILAGGRDASKLAALRDRRCKAASAEIAAALDGHWRAEHLTALRIHLGLWDQYRQEIAGLDKEIDVHLKSMRKASPLPALAAKARVRGRKPHDPAFDVRTALYFATGVDLTAIEGIDEIHALTLVSELGADFTKWPTVKHFTSWLGLCPNFKQTGGQVKSSRTRKGKNRAAHALRLGAWGLMRSASALGAYLRRQRGRLGAPKAITATAHKLARIVYHLVRYGGAYVKESEAEFEKKFRERTERTLHKRARELGYTLAKAETAPA